MSDPKTSAPHFQAGIENIDELLRDLKEVGLNTKKTHKAAVRAGTKIFRDAAEQRAAAITNQSGLKTKLKVRSRKGYIVGSVFPNKGFAFLRPVEYGTKSGWRWARKKGPFKFYMGNRVIVTRLIKHPGTTQRRWLQPAFDESTDAAAAAYGESLRAAIEEARITSEGSDA